MSSSDHVAIGSPGGRSTALWVGGLVLAAAATVVLMLSDDARLLRLGLIAALWAALVGAFAVARMRDRVNDGDRVAAERQRIYELELEREIAARREFEAKAEAEARRRADEDSSAQIRVLRSELAALRETLEKVVGGDVLFERVALRAESTRVRSLSERREGTVLTGTTGPQLAAAPMAPAQPGRAVKPVARPARPAAAPKPEVQQKTEVISRLSGQVPVEDARPRPLQRSKMQVSQAFPGRPGQARPFRGHHPEPPRTEPEEPESGAHAAGTSVNDLLAAYGAGTGQRRRRRRD